MSRKMEQGILLVFVVVTETPPNPKIPTAIAVAKNTRRNTAWALLSLRFGLVIIVRRRSLQIAQGDNSHQVLLPIQHGQPVELPLLHQVSGFVDVLAFATANGCKHHYLPHLTGSRVTPFGCRAHGEVTRGQQADDFPAFTNREYANIVNAHLARRLVQQGVWADHLDASFHDVLNLHEASSRDGRRRREPRCGPSCRYASLSSLACRYSILPPRVGTMATGRICASDIFPYRLSQSPSRKPSSHRLWGGPRLS